jgi:hypothetical protein
VNGDSEFEPRFDPRPPEGLILPPWEDRARFGALNGFYLTIKEVLLTPGAFFGRMPSGIGLVQPLLFAVIIGVIGAFFDWMWTLAGSSLQMFISEDMAEVMSAPFVYGVLFLLSPLTAAVTLAITAGLMHLALIVFGGNRLGFEATFRVAAYAEAAGIVSILPFCGAWLGAIYGLIVAIVGLYKIHDCEPWRAALAVLVPAALCLLTCGGTALMLRAAGITLNQ